MADYDQIMRALRNAHAAGDEAAARRLAQMAKAAKPGGAQPNPDGTYGKPPEGVVMNPRTGQMEDLRSPVNPRTAVGQGEAAALGAMQGLGYDLGDEVIGGLGAVTGVGGEYAREVMREKDRRAQGDFPASYMVPKVGGAVAQSLTLGKLLGLGEATTTRARAVDGLQLGMIEGMLFGAGAGEGVLDRVTGAAEKGVIGGAIGRTAPFAIEGVRRGFDKVIGGPVASMRSAPSEVRASKAAANALRKSGMSADDVDRAIRSAAQEGQPEFVVADALGKPGQRLLGSVYRSADDAQGEIANFLTTRQVGQPERLAQFVDEGFDLHGATANATRAAVKKGRDEAADIAFGGMRASGTPVDIRGVVAAIDDQLAPYVQANIDSPSRGALEGLRRQLVGVADDASYELSDFGKVFAIRKDLSDTISRHYRSGNNELAGGLKAIRSAFDDAMQAASPEYRQAMTDFAASSRTMDAFETGAQMARPGVRAADNAATFRAFSPNEQAAARAGYGDRLLSRIEGAPGETTNRARALTSPKVAEDIASLGKNPALLSNRIARENAMHETLRKVLGGSETAERMLDDAALDTQSMSAIANLLQGRFGAAANAAGGAVMNTMTGRNTATRELIARMLLSGNISSALAPAMRADMARAGQNRVVEALMRSGLRLTE